MASEIARLPQEQRPQVRTYEFDPLVPSKSCRAERSGRLLLELVVSHSLKPVVLPVKVHTSNRLMRKRAYGGQKASRARAKCITQLIISQG